MDVVIQIAVSSEYKRGTLKQAFQNIQSVSDGIEFEHDGESYSLSVLPYSDDGPFDDEIIGVSFFECYYDGAGYHEAQCYMKALQKAYSVIDDIKDKVTDMTGGVVDGSKMTVSMWVYMPY